MVLAVMASSSWAACTMVSNTPAVLKGETNIAGYYASTALTGASNGVTRFQYYGAATPTKIKITFDSAATTTGNATFNSAKMTFWLRNGYGTQAARTLILGPTDVGGSITITLNNPGIGIAQTFEIESYGNMTLNRNVSMTGTYLLNFTADCTP